VTRETARRIGLPESTQRTLFELTESWSGGWAPRGIGGDEIAVPARIARSAADAAFFADIGDTDLAVSALRARGGGILDPAVVDAFVANADALEEREPLGRVVAARSLRVPLPASDPMLRRPRGVGGGVSRQGARATRQRPGATRPSSPPR
jgi:hypothetical protein